MQNTNKNEQRTKLNEHKLWEARQVVRIIISWSLFTFQLFFLNVHWIRRQKEWTGLERERKTIVCIDLIVGTPVSMACHALPRDLCLWIWTLFSSSFIFFYRFVKRASKINKKKKTKENGERIDFSFHFILISICRYIIYSWNNKSYDNIYTTHVYIRNYLSSSVSAYLPATIRWHTIRLLCQHNVWQCRRRRIRPTEEQR